MEEEEEGCYVSLHFPSGAAFRQDLCHTLSFSLLKIMILSNKPLHLLIKGTTEAQAFQQNSAVFFFSLSPPVERAIHATETNTAWSHSFGLFQFYTRKNLSLRYY